MTKKLKIGGLAGLLATLPFAALAHDAAGPHVHTADGAIQWLGEAVQVLAAIVAAGAAFLVG